MKPDQATIEKLLERIADLEGRLAATQRDLVALNGRHITCLAGTHERIDDLSNSLSSLMRDIDTQLEPLLAERLPRIGETMDEISGIIGTAAVYAPERLTLRAPLAEPDPKPHTDN